MMLKRLRNLLINLGLVLASILVMALIGEAVLRLSGKQGPALQTRDAVVGKRYHRGFHDSVYVPESERRVELRFNRDGLRGPDLPYEKPDDVRRVVVLGDSHIVAVATDEDATLVGRLEALLNASARKGERWEVLNFGVSSASTGQELALYREVARRYEPDVVVCAFNVGNDFADNSRRLSSAKRIYFDLDENGDLVRLPFTATSSRGSDWLNLNSRFYVWAKKKASLLKASARQLVSVPAVKKIFNTEEDENMAHAWRLTARLLEAFRDETRADDAVFVLLVLPSPDQVYDDVWQELADLAADESQAYDRDYPDRKLRGIADDLGVPVLTMTSEFRHRAPARSSALASQHLFYNGTWHLNVPAQDLAATLLHEFLRDNFEIVARGPG